MDLLPIVLFSSLAVFCVGALVLRNARGGPGPYSAAAWGLLLAAGLAGGLAGLPGDATAAKIFAAMFPALLLAGELERNGRPVPGWLLSLAWALAVARGGSLLVDPRLPSLLTLAQDVPILVACAWVAWRGLASIEGWAARLLPACFLLLCVPRVVDSWGDLTGGGILDTLPLWVAAALPTVAVQVAVGLEAARRDARDARAELAANVRRFELIANSAFDLVSEHDPQGRFLYVSPSYRSVLGYAPEELIGTDGGDLVHPDDRAALAAFGEAMETSGELAHPRLRLRHRNGSWREVEGTAVRHRDARGEEGVVVVNRDVTDRVRFEENARSAQRFESLLLLAGGIAHDFNNLLVPVVTSIDLLRPDLARDSAHLEILSDLEAGARRATELTRQLLTLSGRGQRDVAPLDLSQLTGEVTRLFVRTLPSRVSLRSKLASGLPPVDGDRDQIRQVVTTLLANAADALDENGGVIGVETGVDVIERGDALALEMNVRLEPGTYVHLDVRDDGRGLDPALRERIFDPFFSTKPLGHGLGLAVLMGTVRGHGGGVEIRTAAGQGTLFRVLLPAEPVVPALGVERPPPAPESWREQGTILLVEDEDTVRRAARRALERLGFSVVEARNGAEAVELFRRIVADVDAVVLDAVMPVLQGDETYRELARIRPDVPVLLTSGFTERTLVDPLGSDAPVAFLAKPYTIAALGAALQQILEPRRRDDD